MLQFLKMTSYLSENDHFLCKTKYFTANTYKKRKFLNFLLVEIRISSQKNDCSQGKWEPTNVTSNLEIYILMEACKL